MALFYWLHYALNSRVNAFLQCSLQDIFTWQFQTKVFAGPNVGVSH